MLKKFLVATSFAALIGSVVACGGEKTTESGMRYIMRKDVAGTTPSDSDFVELNYEMYITTKGKDSLLQSSSQTPGVDRMMVRSNGFAFKGSFEEGFKLLSVGDSAAFFVSADSMFTKQFRMPTPPPFVDKNSTVRLEVGISKIVTKKQVDSMMNAYIVEMAEKERKDKEEAEKQKPLQDEQIKSFIAKNKIAAKSSESGLHYFIKNAGAGAEIKAGDTVHVHYKGVLFDPNKPATEWEKFDSSEGRDPLFFPAKMGAMIQGFDEGVSYLKQGGKAQLFIPSHLGYGAMGQPPIKPFSILVFDVEVVKVVPAKK